MYTGFFKDMSTGVIFGLKLPTGTYTAPGLDRDTQIGSGSTDLMLGGYPSRPDDRRQCLAVFLRQVRWRQPFLYKSAADQGFPDSRRHADLQTRLSGRWRRRHHLQ